MYSRGRIAEPTRDITSDTALAVFNVAALLVSRTRNGGDPANTPTDRIASLLLLQRS